MLALVVLGENVEDVPNLGVDVSLFNEGVHDLHEYFIIKVILAERVKRLSITDSEAKRKLSIILFLNFLGMSMCLNKDSRIFIDSFTSFCLISWE